MDLEDAVAFCLSLGPVEEATPFGEDILVYKIGGKIFAIAGLEDGVGRLNLKGCPEKNALLRERWEAIIPGYHMNKQHWNTLIFDHSLPPALVSELITESYQLVLSGLPKALRASLALSGDR